MAIKKAMANDFDRVRDRFLFEILRKFRFSNPSIDWMMDHGMHLFHLDFPYGKWKVGEFL